MGWTNIYSSCVKGLVYNIGILFHSHCLHYPVKLNIDFKPYLNAKSEILKNILREALKDIPRLNLRDNMPRIIYSVLRCSHTANYYTSN